MEALITCESLTGNTRFAVDIVRAVLERLGHDCALRRVPSTTMGE